MTTAHDELLARIDADIETIESIHEYMGDYEFKLCHYEMVLQHLKSNRAVVELVKPYLEHDIKNVTKVDGVYDKEQAQAWEKVHGHDIRLNCYPEFGCQLLIDPEDLFLTIQKELG